MAPKETEIENRIVHDCLRNLHGIPQAKIEFMLRKGGGPFVGTFRLGGPWGQHYYYLKVVPKLTPMVTDLVIHQIKTSPAPQDAHPLLLSHYISPGLAARLKEKNIEYADCAGNLYLNRMPLYLEIAGQKHASKPPQADRLFRTAGLKLVYLFLRNPQAVNATYRTLAEDAGIALGAIGSLLGELEKRGNLETKEGGERRLLAVEELLQRWQIGYLETLRPKLYQQRCRPAADLAIGRIPQQLQQLNSGRRVLIGGELGASLLSNSFQPDSAVLYVDPELQLKTMLQLRLTPDPEGSITLLQPFGEQCGWSGLQPEGLTLADPLLTFAELQNQDSGTVAERLYRQYLAPRFG
jgi:hypothetical protein